MGRARGRAGQPHGADVTKPPTPTRTVNPAVERATTMLFERAEDVYRTDVVGYGRSGLSVHRALEDALSARWSAAGCTLAPSGLSAVATGVLALVSAGDRVVFADTVYGPTRRFAEVTLPRFGVTPAFVAPYDLEGLKRAADGAAVVVWESPGSLTFEAPALAGRVAAAHAAGALCVCDDTWGGGVVHRALDHGADVSVHALTKYISGGSDVFLGAVLSREPKVASRVAAFVRETGLATSPDDVALALRGLHSLEVRFAAQTATTERLIAWLKTQPSVARLIAPGDPDHPDAADWTEGLGPVFAFELKGSDDPSGPYAEACATRFLNALSVFGLGFSYGGFESLALHANPQLKRTAHPWTGGDGLIRLAIGLEPCETLQADLARGFDAIA